MKTIASKTLIAFAGLLCFRSGSATAGTASTLTVHVSTFRSVKGKLVCRLFAGPDGFPSKATYKVQVTALIPGKKASCVFHDVARGTYAVALFHDENGNGQLDTNFIGIPSEGVGASNNRRPLVGPPSWDDAKFRLARDASLEVTLAY